MENSNLLTQCQFNNRKISPTNELKVNFANKHNDGSVSNYNSQFRSNFLSVAEVKFSDSTNENGGDKENNNNTGTYNGIPTISGNGDFSNDYDSKLTPKRYLNDFDGDSIMSGATSITVATKKKPNIPDGGFGWAVVFASFVISLIIDGIAFSFGLIYTELLAYFNESKTKTAWIGAFFLSVPLLAGPVLSNLVDKYGCRRMTIIGGLIAGIGFGLASISTSVEMLYLTFGLISGFGIGIGYVTAIVSIAFWFDKGRTFATSLGAAGTGIGTFVYAPFTQWLLETYGWRGTTLILAGTLLNVCVCGCLMRDPDWLIEENRLESRSQSMLTVSNSSVCLVEIRKMLEIGTPGEAVLDTLVTNVNTEANQQIYNLDKSNALKKYRSETLLPTYLFSHDFESDVAINLGSRRSLRRKTEDNCTKENIFSISTVQSPPSDAQSNRSRFLKHLASAETLNASEKYSFGDDDSVLSEDYVSNTKISPKYTSRFSLDETMMIKQQRSHSQEKLDSEYKMRGNSLGALLETDNLIDRNGNNDIRIFVPFLDRSEIKSNMSAKVTHNTRRRYRRHNTGEIVSNLRRNIPLRNSHHLQHMRIHRHAMNYRGAMLNTHRYRLKASSCPDIYRNSMTTLAKEEEKWYDNFVDITKSIFDFSMFLDPKFFFFNLSTLFLFIWFIVPYFYITDHLLKYNYKEEDGANLISVIGIFNTIGMIILGYIGDKPWLNVSKTYAVCLVICGISTALMPLAVHNYTYLLILGMIFGLSFSSSFSFIPIILVELVELEDFTCAYGLVLLVQGVGNLIGPPLSGIIFEFTGRWDDAFFLGGFFIAVSGLLAWITGILVDRDEKLEDEEEHT